MKILFFTRRFWPSIGGVEKHCLEIGKSLVKMGHEVTVVSESSTSEESRRIGGLPLHHPRCLKVYYVPVRASEKSKKFRIWGWLWKHRELIKEADIVHCHDVFFWYFPFRFLYPKKKVFTTFHGWEGIYPPRFKAKVVRKISEKLSFGNICAGDFIKKWYGTKADWETYGGVELTQNLKLKTQIENSKLKILFIGRLEKDTGLPIYLKALEEFKIYNLQLEPLSVAKSSSRLFTITFLGDGDLRKEAEKYGRVLGFVDNVGKKIQEADFVFTSGYLSILEAMANERLVFAVYDNPLKEDYLKMSPFSKSIVIESDPKELAKKVKFYIDNPKEEKKMVEEGYNWASEQTWEKLTEKYLELWRVTEV